MTAQTDIRKHHCLGFVDCDYCHLLEKMDIAVEALAFYSTNDIHNYNFDYKDNGQRACEALAKIRGEK